MAFDPNTFYNDLNSASPLYTSDLGQSQGRLEDLIAANQYATNNQSTLSGAPYWMNELGQYIEAQQAVTDQLNAQKKLTGLTSEMQADPNTGAIGYANQQLMNVLPSAYGSGYTPQNIYQSGIPKNIADQWMTNYRDSLEYYTNTVPKMVSEQKTALANAKNKAIQEFYLPRANSGLVRNKINDYYNSPTGEVNRAITEGRKNIYKQRHEAGMTADEKLNRLGLLNSGARENYRTKMNKEALEGDVSNQYNARRKADDALLNFDKGASTAEQNTKNMENSIKTGGYGDLLSGTGQRAVSDYSRAAQTDTNNLLSDNQREIERMQRNDAYLNDLTGLVGDGIGSYFGSKAGY